MIRKSVSIWRKLRAGQDIFGGIFDVPARQQKIAELEKDMAVEGFWNKQEAANKIVTEVSHLKSGIQPIIKFNVRVDDLSALIELVEDVDEEEADEYIVEIRESIAVLMKD